MHRPRFIQKHPFPFLLYLEWGLLAIALLGEFLPGSVPRLGERFPLLNFLSLLGFGLMGLQLPSYSSSQKASPQTAYKIAYTALEIGLIVLAAAAGKNPRIFPFLYVVLMIRSCLIFRMPGRLVVMGIAFSLFLLMVTRFMRRVEIQAPLRWQVPSRPLLFNFVLLLGLVLVLILLLVNALINERQSREKLTIANDQLRQYALRVENLAMAQERARIAREIHDSLGHALTGLNLQMEGALKLWDSNPDQAHSFLRDAKQLGSTALQEVRRSVSAMRSDPLQGMPLLEAIATLAEDFYRTTGIQPHCQIQALSLPYEVSSAICRIVQEALTNIRKYANASEVNISLEAIAPHLHLTIQDNGDGFQIAENQTGFGLQGMRERTIALGGQMQIDSQLGQGCCITVQIPLLQFSG
ncbi:MAG: sensor histidine kinase [Drouetiella hepatica Uher 2000/2452]|jgi:signal transduction histidine kinase|uniref:histidine kinase n=1 Tax=Drouetiella hepatica Uher 2000/2452 TaxID=904376 RepID=A0A951Q6F3_9CYAN|nr:sensor histidine kinase [Drouetiella hepatica Uher 2000/2452]